MTFAEISILGIVANTSNTSLYSSSVRVFSRARRLSSCIEARSAHVWIRFWKKYYFLWNKCISEMCEVKFTIGIHENKIRYFCNEMLSHSLPFTKPNESICNSQKKRSFLLHLLISFFKNVWIVFFNMKEQYLRSPLQQAIKSTNLPAMCQIVLSNVWQLQQRAVLGQQGLHEHRLQTN